MQEKQREAESREERKTVDLCGAEHRGVRCMRHHGHDGQHECPMWNARESLHWD